MVKELFDLELNNFESKERLYANIQALGKKISAARSFYEIFQLNPLSNQARTQAINITQNSDMIRCKNFTRQSATLVPNQFYTDDDSRLLAYIPDVTVILAVIPVLNGSTGNMSGVAISHNSDGAATAIQNSSIGQTVYYDVIFLYK